MAREAGSARRAYGLLRRSSDDSETFGEMAGELEGLVADATPPPFPAWPYYEALLQIHGHRAETADDLDVTAAIAARPALPLTLREAAFRGFVENIVRLGGGAAEADAAYALIDALYGEANALSGTALHAEHYLRENGYERATPGLLAERAAATLLDAEAAEGNRLAAATVLARLGERPGAVELRKSFEATGSERLKAAILKLIAAEPSEAELAWLKEFRPATPEVERLVRAMLQPK